MKISNTAVYDKAYSSQSREAIKKKTKSNDLAWEGKKVAKSSNKVRQKRIVWEMVVGYSSRHIAKN